MIKITNNSKEFFEKDSEVEVVIYGAGNAGKWVGYFLNRLDINFVCYFDRGISTDGALLNGKPIYEPDRLKEYSGKSIKIIVCPICYKEICFDLLCLDRKYNLNALCFVPEYKDFIHNTQRYNINKFLGYFRRKLIIGDAPTIISNDCTAGFIYESLDMIPISPTINTGFGHEDFVKLCQNPQKYLNEEVTDLHWERIYNQCYQAVERPVGMLGDIRICFGHRDELSGIEKIWSVMKENINWDRLVFVFQDGHSFIPLDLVKKFDSINNKHLLVSMRSHFGINSENIVYFKDNWLHSRETIIENNFDLVSWLN